jgi:AraC-like DNA-binding protein
MPSRSSSPKVPWSAEVREDEARAEELKQRFGVASANTLLSSADGGAPISISRLHSELAQHEPTQRTPQNGDFALHVSLRAMPNVDLWIDDRHVEVAPTQPGALFLMAFGTSPIAHFHAPFELIRFHLPEHAAAFLNDEALLGKATGIRPNYGAYDQTMHALSTALLPALLRSHEVSAIFVDHVVLALHAHLLKTYGGVTPKYSGPAGLAPWQQRRVKELLDARLDGSVSLLELARECDLSSGHFSRAFKTTTGQSPHQWLLDHRVARAKSLMSNRSLNLAEIAKACGFVDLSHFIRVFSARTRQSPGEWRRERS